MPASCETIRHNAKWKQSLEMIDELAAWGHKPPAVAADAGYGDTTAFRLGLTGRGINYVVAVTFTPTAHLATATPETAERSSTRGRALLPQYPDRAPSLKALGLGRREQGAAPGDVVPRNQCDPKTQTPP